MPNKNISIPKNDNINGILRWISKDTKKQDLHGASLVKISYDSLLNNEVSFKSPIGYNETNKLSYFASNTNEGKHWYQIDMQSFHITLTDYLYAAGEEHYQYEWKLLYSNNGEQWDVADDREFKEEVTTTMNFFKLKNPVTGRYFKLEVNSKRRDDAWDLSIASLEFYGILHYFSFFSCKKEANFDIKQSFFIFVIIIY